MSKKLIVADDPFHFSALIDVVMNALAAVFILLVIYMLGVRPESNIEEIIRRGQKIVASALDKAIEDSRLAGEGIGHRVDGHRQIITFESDLLFSSADYNLDKKGEYAIEVVGDPLREFQDRLYDPESKAGFFSTISIDGHTDGDPPSRSRNNLHRAVLSNWHLSSFRAISVLEELRLHGISESKMSATGYASYRFVVDPDTEGMGEEEVKRRNRRVEITLIYSPEDIRAAILKSMQESL